MTIFGAGRLATPRPSRTRAAMSRKCRAWTPAGALATTGVPASDFSRISMRERHLAEERHAEPLGLVPRAAVAENVGARRRNAGR